MTAGGIRARQAARVPRSYARIVEARAKLLTGCRGAATGVSYLLRGAAPDRMPMRGPARDSGMPHHLKAGLTSRSARRGTLWVAMGLCPLRVERSREALSPARLQQRARKALPA